MVRSPDRRWMKTLETQVANERKEQQDADQNLESYQARLGATSGIEAKYAELVHESQEAREKYQICKPSSNWRSKTESYCREKPGKISTCSILHLCPLSRRSQTVGSMWAVEPLSLSFLDWGSLVFRKRKTLHSRI